MPTETPAALVIYDYTISGRRLQGKSGGQHAEDEGQRDHVDWGDSGDMDGKKKRLPP